MKLRHVAGFLVAPLVLSGCGIAERHHFEAAEQRCAVQYPFAKGTAGARETCIADAEQSILPQTVLIRYDEAARLAAGGAVDSGEAPPAAAKLAYEQAVLRAREAESEIDANEAVRQQQYLNMTVEGVRLMQTGQW